MPLSTLSQRMREWFQPVPEPGGGPLFTVVIPTFHAADKLERSIASVLRQPRELWELVVVDGGSEDGTAGVLRAHAGEIACAISEPDAGVYDAMNKGVARASGRYLYFLGAGDILRDGALERVAACIPRRGIGFVYGNVFMRDRNVVWDGAWTAQKFRTRTPCQQAVFYDRRVFARHGGFELRYPTLADYALNIRCFGDCRVEKIFVNDIIADYEGGGLSASCRDERFHEERPALLQRHLGIKPKRK
ncbi:MAG: glycosyltransferase family 2 protein [Chthoniobacteraceae bacterium]